VAVEVSITSNLATGAVPVIDRHPLPWFLRHDVPVCLNTDIPVFTGCTIQDEQRMARSISGDSDALVATLASVADRHAFGLPR
jgi:adenosine deaminase